jgi:hypothetical protein
MSKPASASHRRARTTANNIQSVSLRFMKRRDALRSKFSPPPTPQQHISNAVLEAWADGKLSESQVMEQIEKCHGGRAKCARCLESVEYYRQLMKAS